MASEEAKEIFQNEEFKALYAEIQDALEKEEEEGDVGEDLAPEDDEGFVEYKFNMCGINMAKVDKRMT